MTFELTRPSSRRLSRSAIRMRSRRLAATSASPISSRRTRNWACAEPSSPRRILLSARRRSGSTSSSILRPRASCSCAGTRSMISHGPDPVRRGDNLAQASARVSRSTARNTATSRASPSFSSSSSSSSCRRTSTTSRSKSSVSSTASRTTTPSRLSATARSTR